MRRQTVKRVAAKKQTLKRIFSIVMLVYMMAMLVMPFQSFGAGPGSPPEMPYEKMIAKKGNWYTSQFSYEGEKSLIVGYRGSFDKDSRDMFFTFDVKETTVLTGIYIPFKGLLRAGVEMVLVSGSGNYYQGFWGSIDYVGTAKEAIDFSNTPSAGGASEAGGDQEGPEGQEGEEYTGEGDYTGGDYTGGYEESLTSSRGNSIIYYQPEEAIVLPKGSYMIYLDGSAWPADGYFVKGMDYKAYEKYKTALIKWAGEEEKEILGNEELGEDFWQMLINELSQDPLWMGESVAYKTPVFELNDHYVLDEIILSTWNGGEGVRPGLVYLYDEEQLLVDVYQSQGYSRGEDANTFWVVMPDILLPPGLYYIDLDDQWALDFDEDGEPLFAVSVSPAPDLPTVFTGTYRINLDLYKIRTLMGNVDPPEKAFNLRNHEIAVIDKGEFIEIIGKYEGMPFSQNCPVLERGNDYAIVGLDFRADLSGLPYKAKIAADAEILFEKDTNGRLQISAEGFGYYDRAASKDKGADSNAYSLTAKGNRVKDDLPPFVMTAIGAAYGAGNIPGPDSPIEAATGMLFPPLIGLVVATLQSILKPKALPEGISKELKPKLSVGEEAMKKANHSMADLLVSEKEKEAWRIMADALGSTGGDPDDPISIGDNEIRDAKAAAAAAGPSSGGVFGGYDDEPGYDGGYDVEPGYDGEPGYEGRSDSPAEAHGPESYGPESQGETFIPVPEGKPWDSLPDELEIVTDAKGRKTIFVKDPETGEYINEENNSVLSPENYREFVLKGIDKDREQIEKNWQDNISGFTEQDFQIAKLEHEIWKKQQELEMQIKLERKYGVSTKAEAMKILHANEDFEKDFIARQQFVAKVAGVGEAGATVVGGVCDASLDALSKFTGPVGKGINSGYKVLKNIGSEVGEKGVSWKSIKVGGIRGAGEGVRVWIPGDTTAGAVGKYVSVVVGDTVAGYVDDGAAGATAGLYTGFIKGALLEASDQLGKSPVGTKMPNLNWRNNAFLEIGKGGKPMERVFTSKLGKNMVDSFGIKPYVTKPGADAIKKALK